MSRTLRQAALCSSFFTTTYLCESTRMTITIELAAFTVREGAESALLAERAEMVAALRRAFPAALAAWLTKQDDGSWLDVILWHSRREAEEAARRINEVPEAKHWFRHIAESKGLRHVEVAHEELFELRYLRDRS
jgi:hypothetical protein